MKEQIVQKFKELYGENPIVVKTPGRINIIGEHTDYNEGFVLPASVNKEIFCAIHKNDKGILRFYAFDINESFEASVDKIEPSKTQWANYLLGVLAQFKKKNLTLEGFDCVFGGNIPIGTGMSSSAAIECGLANGVNHMFNFNLDKFELALMGQKAEHEYAGVKCGIMDQFAVLFGKANQVVKLDCRSLEYQYYPFDLSNHAIILCDTVVKHELASSEYNTRRQECFDGVEVLKKHFPTINSLRDVTVDMLIAHESEMNPVVYKRCKYVVEENQRVIDTCDAGTKGDLAKVGQLMYMSHEGLSKSYEVSCPELDELVEIAKTSAGVEGARMMGGGFGGCTINLVQKDHVESFSNAVIKNYYEKHGKEPNIIVTQIEDGSTIIE